MCQRGPTRFGGDNGRDARRRRRRQRRVECDQRAGSVPVDGWPHCGGVRSDDVRPAHTVNRSGRIVIFFAMSVVGVRIGTECFTKKSV